MAAAQQLRGLFNLLRRCHHGQQNAHRAVRRRAQHGAELVGQQLRPLERQPDGAQPERGVGRLRNPCPHGTGDFIAADIQRAEGNAASAHRTHNGGHALILFIFAGQIIAQCARRKGAYRVIVVDVLEGKLALARRLGADITLNPGQDVVIEAVKDLTNGLGADVVVEAAGTAESFNTASEIIKHNGKFVFYSWVTTPVTLNISRWHDDGLEFINTCLVHHTWQQRYVWCPEALRPVAQGLVDVKPLITDEFKLDDIKAGFDLADKDDAAIKIVFRP